MTGLKIRILCILLLFAPCSATFATIIYVAVQGSDDNPGTLDLPLASIDKAQDHANPGDTIYIRGGEYNIMEDDISRVYQNLFACYAFLDKSGTPGNTIKYWAFPGEIPVFNLSNVKPADQRVVGYYVTADYVHLRGLEITGVQVTITSHTESYCVYSYGNHNIYELLKLHDNQGTGLRHRRGGNNLILNCDSYRNHDYTSENGRGGNTDGFGCHPHAGGTGNVFRGCRSWFNSDDGYEVIGAMEAVKFENCWAMYNGYSTSFASLGDGNGFKAGGHAGTAVGLLPNPIPRHTVQFCLAVKNKASGFYANHHIGGSNWYNNSAYRNGNNYNMLNRMADNVTDVPGYDHVMRNNLGFNSSYEIRNVNPDLCDLSHNYFDLEVLVSGDDFLSLDEALLQLERLPDGALPEIDFMRLSQASDLVDKGLDIGFPFYGVAPDLGAFEQDYFEFPDSNATWYQHYYPESYWEEGQAPESMIFGMLDHDTIINGLEYQKLFRFFTDPPAPESAVCIGALREGPMKKIYYRGEHPFSYPVSDTGDILLYDFSIQIGDTIREGIFTNNDYLLVSKIETVKIGDEYRKRIHFEDLPYTKWIEGIGNERGLIFYSGELPLDGLWGDLVCFRQDDVELYHNSNYFDCYEGPVGNDSRTLAPSDMKISPNPCLSGYTWIESSEAIMKIHLHSISGQLLMALEGSGSRNQKINTSRLLSGLYIIRLIDSQKRVCSQKLLVTN